MIRVASGSRCGWEEVARQVHLLSAQAKGDRDIGLEDLREADGGSQMPCPSVRFLVKTEALPVSVMPHKLDPAPPKELLRDPMTYLLRD